MDDDDFMDDEEEYDLVRSCSHCSQFLNWYIKPIMISVFDCVFVCVCVCKAKRCHSQNLEQFSDFHNRCVTGS